MHRLLILTTVFLLIAPGCDSPTSHGEEVLIRIQNSSNYTMTSIKVAFPKEEVSYGDLVSGAKSDYKTISGAYRYAFISTVVEEKLLAIIPIDYVGESLLEPGLYTYKLYIHEDSFNSEHYQYLCLWRGESIEKR